jgi:hypothetical protein
MERKHCLNSDFYDLWEEDDYDNSIVQNNISHLNKSHF